MKRDLPGHTWTARPWDVGPLPGITPSPPQLSMRDVDNDTARAAYTLGHRRGWQQGFQAGRQEGLATGRGDVEEGQARATRDAALALHGVVQDLRRGLDGLEHELADAVVMLAVDIARAVVRRELQSPDAALLPAAREAVRALGGAAQPVTLRMHPAVAIGLEAQLERMDGCGFVVVRDPALAPGSCLVDNTLGVADIGLATRWRGALDAIGRPDDAPPHA